jgi:hypothetical protein
MSRQFRVYLLPQDAEDLIHRLKSQVDLSVIQPYSPVLFPVPAESPIQSYSPHYLGENTVGVDCCLAPVTDPDIRMRFIQARSQWNVQAESEVIEFKGCDHSESILLQGRFYFQSDLLSHGMIVPKRTEFLNWADKVFRIAKKSLRWSKPLEAYVGARAEQWREEGGQFAIMMGPHGLIYSKKE